MSVSEINRLVDDLASEDVGACCDNVYKVEFKKNNLKLYLNNIYKTKPNTLLVGEALGFKGCGRTGIPFKSEFILNANKLDGYTTEGNGNSPTCTIVNEILRVYEFNPLLWNVFPFRPFKVNDITENRPPNFTEVELGFKYLERIIKIFQIEHILAVGKVSFKILSENYENITYVRHPANGGKVAFVTGISEWKASQVQTAINTL